MNPDINLIPDFKVRVIAPRLACRTMTCSIPATDKTNSNTFIARFNRYIHLLGRIIMKLAEINAIAKKHGIVHSRLSKTELIKSIQGEEGNFDCYATASIGECDQACCSWRVDCFADASSGKPLIA